MSLTKNDIQTIKKLLAEQSAQTERKIHTAVINLERKIDARNFLSDSVASNMLKAEIQASEDNMKREMKNIYANLSKEFKQHIDIFEISLETQYKVLENRIDKLENTVVANAHEVLANFSNRILKLEQQIAG